VKNGHKSESERRLDRIERGLERSELRMDRIERVLAQNNRLVSGLAVAGRRLRSNVRGHEKLLADHQRVMAEHTKSLADSDARMTRLEFTVSEIGDKLNGLIGYVDGLPRPS
jgi:chromosome segregation ATPase